MNPEIDVLIPTYNRPGPLAVNLTSLAFQEFRSFRILVSDQGEDIELSTIGEIKAVQRVLKLHGIDLSIEKHLPRRGMAEQRHHLLNRSTAPYVLYLDDDLILEPYVFRIMHKAIQEEACGFVGCSVIGLSYIEDHRPHQEDIELWSGPVRPERVRPYTKEWNRVWLHSAANLFHVQTHLGVTPDQPRKYKVSWVGACVLFDAASLRDVGGFSFWEDLPDEHAGEDVLAQLRVMSKYGGCGLIPSGVYHQELPTTIENRFVDAPYFLETDSTQFEQKKTEVPNPFVENTRGKTES